MRIDTTHTLHPEARLTAAIVELSREMRHTSEALERTERETMAHHQEEQLGAMREGADARFASGLASGIGSLGAGALGMASAGASETDTRWLDGASKAMTGTGSVVQAAGQLVASAHDIRSEGAKMRAEGARDARANAAKHREEAGGMAQRAIDQLAEVTRARAAMEACVIRG